MFLFAAFGRCRCPSVPYFRGRPRIIGAVFVACPGSIAVHAYFPPVTFEECHLEGSALTLCTVMMWCLSAYSGATFSPSTGTTRVQLCDCVLSLVSPSVSLHIFLLFSFLLRVTMTESRGQSPLSLRLCCERAPALPLT